jgi:hypothetical protein
LTAERKEEELLSEIKIVKERVKVQDKIIDKMREENKRHKNDNESIQKLWKTQMLIKPRKRKILNRE